MTPVEPPSAPSAPVAAREMFVRCLTAGGVALGAISLAFALAAPPRWDGDRASASWRAADIVAATLGLWMALAARWIARDLPWPADLPPGVPSAPRLASRGLAVGVGVLLAVALFLPYVPSRPAWHPPCDPVVAALAVAVAAVLAASEVPAAGPYARASRLGVGLAVTRAGGLLGCAATVRSLVQLFPTGRSSDFVIAGFDPTFRMIEPIVGGLAFTGLALVGVLPWRRERRDPAPARRGTLVAAVAAVAAVTLVGPIVEETMRWRAGRRFQTQHSIDWQWPGDYGEAVRGYAERAGVLAAGFAGFVLVAAIAGRRGRGDARPGR